jgi:methylthioribulose-1-phosphate dehydratase
MIRDSMTFDEAARRLVEVGRRFDGRGWVFGTSGNFSIVVSERPLRLAMTPSGAFKGELTAGEIVEVDEAGKLVAGPPAARPSAEARLHLEIARLRGAGAVLHTHSIWSTVLSEQHASSHGLAIEGFEMLKGLAGVSTHAHHEWVPILENDQDMERLAAEVGDTLGRHPAAHALLLRRHGMYTWGDTLRGAIRHVEIMEFLLEVIGRDARGV